MPVTIDILIENPEWIAEIPECEVLAEQLCYAVLEAASLLKVVDECECSVVLADDAFIRELNKQYRGKDAPTNVLSFPCMELEPGHYQSLANQQGLVVLGDIILSLDTLKREAQEQGKTVRDHFCHLFVHGTLHLLGYDHETEGDATVMEQLEIDILHQFGLASPYEVLEE